MQVIDPAGAGDAYPFEGTAYELAEELEGQSQFSIGFDEFFPERDVIEAINDELLMIGQVEVRPFKHKGVKYWATVDMRHPGLACYVLPEDWTLEDVIAFAEVDRIPDAFDEFADGVEAAKLKALPIVHIGHNYCIWEA
jgi:hypothetical protein